MARSQLPLPKQIWRQIGQQLHTVSQVPEIQRFSPLRVIPMPWSGLSRPT